MKRQPSDRQLLKWLRSGSSRLDAFVASSPDNAERLDRLTQLDGVVRANLDGAVAAPSLLHLASRIDRTQQGGWASALVREVLVSGATTASILFAPQAGNTTDQRHDLEGNR